MNYHFPVLAVSLVLVLAGCRHDLSLPGRASTYRHTVFPIGIYSVSNTNDFGTVRAAGFNLIAGPAQGPFLNAAKSHGLKVLAAPGTFAGPHFKPDAARAAVRQHDRHPALWAWYIIDEPDLNKISPANVRTAHQAVKKAGARKPTALVIFQGAQALHYANIADITMIDRYPIPWLPLANFPQHVRLVRLALGTKKPLVAVIQAFDWSYYPKLLPGEKNLRPPTYTELRCMTFCALAQRANGIFYYCFNDGRWKMSEHPEVWQALKEVVAEVRALDALFTAEHLWLPYSHSYVEREKRFNRALESSVLTAFLRVQRSTPALPAGTYLLAVNTTPDLLHYRISTPPLAARAAIDVLREERQIPLADGWLADEFEPYAVHIYGPF